MTHAPFSSADPRKQIPFSGQFADIHCGAEVLKVGVCSKFYRHPRYRVHLRGWVVVVFVVPALARVFRVGVWAAD
jgi:hypothetical protein